MKNELKILPRCWATHTASLASLDLFQCPYIMIKRFFTHLLCHIPNKTYFSNHGVPSTTFSHIICVIYTPGIYSNAKGFSKTAFSYICWAWKIFLKILLNTNYKLLFLKLYSFFINTLQPPTSIILQTKNEWRESVLFITVL